MVDTMNYAGLDYATLGNHEFDLDENYVLRAHMKERTKRSTQRDASQESNRETKKRKHEEAKTSRKA